MSPPDPVTNPEAPPPAQGRKPKWRERIKPLLEEYGTFALVIYFGLFFLVWGVMTVICALGLRQVPVPEGWWSKLPLPLVAGYIATKATQPLRIAATLVFTPAAAKLWERLRGRSRPAPKG
jgi:uncharacterized membrane protein HdeD (DUF308 family)